MSSTTDRNRVLSREVEAVMVPYGNKFTIPAGTKVSLMQTLGGSFTIMADFGMARLDGQYADAIGEAVLAAAVVIEDRQRKRWRRRETIVALDKGGDIVGSQHFECGALCRAGKGVRVFAHEQRPGDAVLSPVIADGLRDGEDVRFGEGGVVGSATMPTGAEADELLRVAGVRLVLPVIAFKFSHVDQRFSRRGLAGERVESHSDVSLGLVLGPAKRSERAGGRANPKTAILQRQPLRGTENLVRR